MTTVKRPLAFIGGLAATAGLLAGTLVSAPLMAESSHREAPMIAGDPYADLTDLYAFVSPDAPDTVTFIMTFPYLWQPYSGFSRAAGTAPSPTGQP